MKISLTEVSNKNYEAICDLEVTEEQENYVASNTWSLVESAYNQGYSTRAICLDEEPVGFLMWIQDSASKVSIWRFMIDKKYQQKGIGRTALSLALNEIKKSPKLKEIEICYNPQNPVAKTFYSSFGFVEIGMSNDGEDMLAIISL
ncbi:MULTISPECIES: GNAT family N-acetyltransferase [Delftia]|uniref:GNAT family N-acetyltransferase n=1 Tax=Delftia lacustris TaxID=558537 RepID=A0A7T2YVT0_9BURK|nr:MULTISPECIES: GNAT family N-acetyltransferase [Delftia]QPS83098.1 GNAT family N-acetyltransferase [Delftia lacustris]